MSQVRSQTQSIALLCRDGIAFNIPSYQRPYVWPAEDVTKLLDDIERACASGQASYYIGTLLSAPSSAPAQPAARVSYELIDGQQRCTTLTLLALAFHPFQKTAHPLSEMMRLGNQPRLTFRIRREAQAFLASEAGLPAEFSLDAKSLASPYLVHMYQGLKAAQDRLAQMTEQGIDLRVLADYVFANVVWVNNIVPPNINLNRLFARINTSGVQLEQSDILKAQLLNKIADHRQKRQCDAMWQACERMGDYFERNVRRLFPRARWEELSYNDLARFNEDRFPFHTPNAGEAAGKSHAFTLSQLASMPSEPGHEQDDRGDDPPKHHDAKRYCRSVIGFPLLLIHAYRIHRAQSTEEDISCRVNPAQLSQCFNDLVDGGSGEDAVRFIHCLWRVRYQFDRWVAKWVPRDGDDVEQLQLRAVYFNQSEKRLTRDSTPATSDLVQLQAVRYFTGERSAQYWLGPFLHRMVADSVVSEADALSALEAIDDGLSLARATQKEASFAMMRVTCVARRDFDEVVIHLRKSLGTGFEHYWFQKLEYVLWKERRNLGFDEERLRDFRITSKNSVEHVHPQYHLYREEQLHLDVINGFGNLALLSPGENSSYSNMDPAQKKVDFDRKRTYDALKLAHLFSLMRGGKWNAESMREHRDAMISCLEAHYSATHGPFRD